MFDLPLSPPLPLPPLTQRIASVIDAQKERPTPRKPKQADPTAKLLDELHGALVGDNSEQSLEICYRLTALLGKDQDVSFAIPEPDEDEEEEAELSVAEPLRDEPPDEVEA